MTNQRQIKFRAWNVALKRFSMPNPEFINLDEPLNEWDENYIFQQFTGLKDKKGVEIYEGDIIKGLIVKYHHSYFALERITDSGISWTGLTYEHELEVVGNIYEHPDLLI